MDQTTLDAVEVQLEAIATALDAIKALCVLTPAPVVAEDASKDAGAAPVVEDDANAPVEEPVEGSNPANPHDAVEKNA